MMERENLTVAVNNSRSVWPVIRDADLLPDDLSHSLKLTFIVAYTAIIILALGGNGLMVAAVVADRRLRTVTNTFMVSLAISDILIATVNMPVQLWYYISNEWTLGELMCKLTRYVQGVVIVNCILTLTGIAVDRYYAICHPLWARHVHTVRRAVRLVVLFWVISLVVVGPQLAIQRLEPLIAFDQTSGSARPRLRIVQSCAEFFPDYRINVAYTMFTYCVVYVLPVAVMLTAYALIARELARRYRHQRASSRFSDAPSIVIGGHGDSIHGSTEDVGGVRVVSTAADRKQRLRDKRVIVRMLVAIVLLFAVSWFPFFTGQVYLLWDTVAHRRSITRTLFAILQLLAYSNTATNPIIYCFLSENFNRQRLRAISSCFIGSSSSPTMRSRSPSLRLGRASPAVVARRQRIIRQSSSAASSPMSVTECKATSTYRKHSHNLQLHYHHRQQQCELSDFD